jgi:hypothetical protein
VALRATDRRLLVQTLQTEGEFQPRGLRIFLSVFSPTSTRARRFMAQAGIGADK